MKTLTVRLTDAEHALLKSDAASLRLTMAPYLLNMWSSNRTKPFHVDAPKSHTHPQQSAAPTPKLNKPVTEVDRDWYDLED